VIANRPASVVPPVAHNDPVQAASSTWEQSRLPIPKALPSDLPPVSWRMLLAWIHRFDRLGWGDVGFFGSSGVGGMVSCRVCEGLMGVRSVWGVSDRAGRGWGRADPVEGSSLCWFWRMSGGGSAELGEVADAGEGGVVGGGPWPSGGKAEYQLSCVVDDSSGQFEQSVADGVAVGELLGGTLAGVVVDPPVQVVGDHRGGHPGGVGEEPP